MWLAALTGRLAFLTRRLRGHTAVRARRADPATGPGDTISLFENLQHVLRLATECPSGRFGDEIRRAACELTEAGSVRRRHAHRRRMLKTIARIQARQAYGRCGDGAPSPALLKELTHALRRNDVLIRHG
jgi:hypothetical protein